MSKGKIFHIIVTEDEQWWIHDLARANKTSAVQMIINLLEQKSKELGISLPKKRTRRIVSPQTFIRGTNPKAKYMEKIDKELEF